jgi:hypothetical protein
MKNLLTEIDAYITIGQHRFPITLSVYGTESRTVAATHSQPAEGGMDIQCIGIGGDYLYSEKFIEFVDDIIELDGLEA